VPTAGDLVSAIVEVPVVAGVFTLLLGLFGYLFKELRRKDEGVWAIIADRDREIEKLEKDRDYWRDLCMKKGGGHRGDG
jgi:hypothetical protein